jgi:VCBS repeat-containing protein
LRASKLGVCFVLTLAACLVPTDDKQAPGTEDEEQTVNAPPTLTAEGSVALSTAQDTPLTLTLPIADPNGDTLTILTTTAPSHGTVQTAIANGTVTLTYTPAAGYAGPDSFALQADDGRGGRSPIVAFTVTVTAVAAGLQGTNDSVTISEDEASATFETLLANDVGPASDPLRITAVTPSVKGVAVTVASDTSVTYAPGASFNSLSAGSTETDSFTYTLTNGTLSTTVTVSVTVTGVNDAPAIAPIVGAIVCRPGEAIAAATSASDVDTNDTLTFSTSPGSCGATMSIDSSGAISGECPAAGTECAVTVSVNDGTTSSSTPLTISANTIFVEKGASGTGEAWGNSALGNLQTAIDQALVSGKTIWAKKDDVWTAADVGAASATGPTGAVLTIDGTPSGPAAPTGGGVTLIGGFAGTESLYSQRGLAHTQVRGSIDTSPSSDDAEHVIRIVNAHDILIDGFHLSLGYSDDQRSGAGLYVDSVSGLTVRGSAIEQNVIPLVSEGNSAGAGAYVNRSTDVVFERVMFANNNQQGGQLAYSRGAALYFNRTQLTVDGCIFFQNSVESGPGYAAGSQAFFGSLVFGGALSGEHTTSSLVVSNSAFYGNEVIGGLGASGDSLAIKDGAGGTGGKGGAISLENVGSATLTNNHFHGNGAFGGDGGHGGNGLTQGEDGGLGGGGGEGQGGAVYHYGSGDLTISSCRFFFNRGHAGDGSSDGMGSTTYPALGIAGSNGGDGGLGGAAAGGAVYHDGSGAVTIELSSFVENSVIAGSAGNGGAASGASGSVGDSFPGGAGGDGGRATGGFGGAIGLRGSASITQCSFANNGATGAPPGGGGVGGAGFGSGPAGAPGVSGIAAHVPIGAVAAITGTATITSSAFFANRGDQATSDFDFVTGAVTATNSCVESISAGNVQLSESPFETKAASGELFLKPSTPCANIAAAAGPDVSQLTNATTLALDLDGKDAGAYSLPHAIRSLAYGANGVTFAVEGEQACVLYSASPFAAASVSVALGSSNFSSQQVVLMCDSGLSAFLLD